jgi:hypothetical protein
MKQKYELDTILSHFLDLTSADWMHGKFDQVR